MLLYCLFQRAPAKGAPERSSEQLSGSLEGQVYRKPGCSLNKHETRKSLLLLILIIMMIILIIIIIVCLFNNSTNTKNSMNNSHDKRFGTKHEGRRRRGKDDRRKTDGSGLLTLDASQMTDQSTVSSHNFSSQNLKLRVPERCRARRPPQQARPEH